MLHGEELMLGVHAGGGAIWKTRDELEARDVVVVVL